MRASSGLSNVANVVVRDVNTKATQEASQAWVDLDLGGTFQLTQVKVGEDNAGTQSVQSYDVQCWNGTGWDTELFRDTETNVAVPQLDDRPLANGCTSSRVRVNPYNPGGGIEVFELEV